MTLAQAIVFGLLTLVSLLIYQDSNRPEVLVFTFVAVTVWTLIPKILDMLKAPKSEKQQDKNAVTDLKLALEKAVQPPQRMSATEQADSRPEVVKLKT